MSAPKSQIDSSTGNHSQFFLAAIRPLLFMNRILALSPMIITQNIAGQYRIAISKKAETYSRVMTPVLYIYSCSIVTWLYQQILKANISLKIYYYSRLSISTLIQITCWKHRYMRLEALQVVGGLGISITKTMSFYFIFTPIIYGMCIIVLVFMSKNNQPATSVTYQPTLLANMTALPDFLPAVVLVCLCAEFNCQIATLREAITELHDQIKPILKQPSEMKKSLRPIIRRHQKLRRACAIINEAYGNPMLLVTSATFLEVTYCIFFYLCTTQPIDGRIDIYCLSWVVINTVPLIVVMQECQKAEREANNIICISCETKGMAIQESFGSQIEMYEWGVQLRQLAIKFSALGFFDLNGGQLNTIMSTIISYVIILIQNVNWDAP